MSLITNLSVFLPNTPTPPDSGMVSISNALEQAMTICIRTSFVPTFGTLFLSFISQSNPFLISLAAYFDIVINPIIAAALSVQASVGGPVPAWASVQPSFDALNLAAPNFMAGEYGLLFWRAIILTIKLAIAPAP
jgi:hypothetical protein